MRRTGRRTEIGTEIGTVRRRWLLPALLGVLALVAASLAVASTRLSETPRPSGDVAWVDATATNDVIAQVSSLARALFSVTPTTVASARKTASSALVGQAIGEYQKLYGDILTRATSQHVSLATTIDAVGVTTLTAGSAQLLVLADQTASVGSQTKSGPAQIALSATQTAGRWRISGIRVL